MSPLANLPPARRYLVAVGFMIASAAAFSLMNLCVRLLSAELHTTVIVFWRNLFSIGIMLPWVLATPGIMRTTRLKGHIWRSAVGIVGMQSWFYCVATLPLTQATALSFTAPLFTTLFATMFLGEKADGWRWLAVFGGFAGVLVVLQPNVADFKPESLTVLFTASLWAVVGMLVKSLTHTEPPLRIVFFMACFMFLFSIPLALRDWQWLSAHQALLVLATALASTATHLCMVRAYSLADVVKLVPFDFTRLIFTALLSYLVLHEASSTASWVGAGIIVACAFLIAQRDARFSRRLPASD